MDARRHTIVGLGELLWDCLPEGKQLGGATANFAYVSGLLGAEAIVASRIGADEPGREALGRLEQMGLSARYLQLDTERPTGTVEVRVDERGQPSYMNRGDEAWDYLEWTRAWEELAGRADAVCFGTLAQRSPQSRDTIRQFLRSTRPGALRVFDVNLRHSFSDAELLAASLRLAHVAKLNDDELPKVCQLLGLGASEPLALARKLIGIYELRMVAITRGERGSLLVTVEEARGHTGYEVDVADTIGAGDAFTAALVHFTLRGAPLARIGEAANRAGAWMATQVGATPPVEPEAFRQIVGEFKT
ncbi:MAG TPA: carbohydrate kinase [Pyrinomonadaceae bacterium]|nr:carbohydrate kinase [Pyrinomonadaceae bacterium]